MKIGIMSMQRVKNYGSFLQAYGLKRLIESLGHEVVFVDYRFERSLVPQKRNYIKRALEDINIVRYIKKKKNAKVFDKKFGDTFIPSLCGAKMNYFPKDIDLLVIGSDEVFNCTQSYPVGYSRELFGRGYENIPVISYAACFGQTSYDLLKKFGIDKEVACMLKKFRSISVRDKNSLEIVKKLTNTTPAVHLDPVLIADYPLNSEDDIKDGGYIIVYAYPGRLTANEEKEIKAFARRHNKKIISFGMYQNVSDKEIVVNPLDIFAYFAKADFIITDTFHGSIFSIKTHSNFCTIIRKGSLGNNNKLVDLLNRLNKSEAIIDDIQELEKHYARRLDYAKTDSIIKYEKKQTMDYLSKEIGRSES